ncbi:unnamed protein product, partial [Laminaria digitata]
MNNNTSCNEGVGKSIAGRLVSPTLSPSMPPPPPPSAQPPRPIPSAGAAATTAVMAEIASARAHSLCAVSSTLSDHFAERHLPLCCRAKVGGGVSGGTVACHSRAACSKGLDEGASGSSHCYCCCDSTDRSDSLKLNRTAAATATTTATAAATGNGNADANANAGTIVSVDASADANANANANANACTNVSATATTHGACDGRRGARHRPSDDPIPRHHGPCFELPRPGCGKPASEPRGGCVATGATLSTTAASAVGGGGGAVGSTREEGRGFTSRYQQKQPQQAGPASQSEPRVDDEAARCRCCCLTSQDGTLTSRPRDTDRKRLAAVTVARVLQLGHGATQASQEAVGRSDAGAGGVKGTATATGGAVLEGARSG